MAWLWVWLALVAVMGAAASSFLQLPLDRAAAPDGRSLLARSRCPRCPTVLRGRAVLPVLGFVLSHGRCSTCTTAIPRKHLLSELTGAVVWAGAAALAAPTLWLPALLVAPAAAVAVLLVTPARRELAARLALIALLVITGVAVLLIGLAGALTGRWAAYLTAGAVAVLALPVAGRLEQRRLRPAAV